MSFTCNLNINIRLAAFDADIEIIAALANQIWKQHFTAIIGSAQVEYMLQKFQSVGAISQQISSGYEYYLLTAGGEPAAYFGLVPDLENRKIMLSKFYVLQSKTRLGLGKAILDFIELRCNEANATTLWLTVNKYNLETIAWYKRNRFAIIEELKSDIGAGFYMDDFIMEKKYGNK